MASLFHQQFFQLIVELSSILTEKWPSTVNSAYSDLKSIMELQRSLMDSKIQDSEINQSEISNQISSLKTCNSHYSRLKDSISFLESYLNRLFTIQKNLTSLISTKTDILNSCGMLCSQQNFKSNLDDVINSFKNEFTLKSEIVSNLLFKSRFDEAFKREVKVIYHIKKRLKT